MAVNTGGGATGSRGATGGGGGGGATGFAGGRTGTAGTAGASSGGGGGSPTGTVRNAGRESAASQGQRQQPARRPQPQPQPQPEEQDEQGQQGQAGQYVTRQEMQDVLQSFFGRLEQMIKPAPQGAQARQPARPAQRRQQQPPEEDDDQPPEAPVDTTVGRRAKPHRALDPDHGVEGGGEQTFRGEVEYDEKTGGFIMPRPLSAPGDPGDVICGKEGTVKIGSSDLPEITSWSFKPSVSLQEYASNKTNGFKRKVCGSKTASGSIEGMWDRNEPITDHFKEGDSVTLLLHLDATRLVTVPAIIKSMDLEVDIDENAVEAWSAEFDADGEWTYTIAANTP